MSQPFERHTIFRRPPVGGAYAEGATLKGTTRLFISLRGLPSGLAQHLI